MTKSKKKTTEDSAYAVLAIVTLAIVYQFITHLSAAMLGVVVVLMLLFWFTYFSFKALNKCESVVKHDPHGQIAMGHATWVFIIALAVVISVSAYLVFYLLK